MAMLETIQWSRAIAGAGAGALAGAVSLEPKWLREVTGGRSIKYNVEGRGGEVL
jgi:hypothetical protein